MQLRSKFTKVGSKFIKFFYLATQQASAGRDEVGKDVDVLRRPATEAKILMPLSGLRVVGKNNGSWKDPPGLGIRVRD